MLIATAASTEENPTVRDFLLAGLVEGPWRDALVRKGHTFPDDVYELTPLDADPKAETWMAENWVVDPVADPAFLAAIAQETVRVPLGTWLGAARALLEVDNTERLKDLTVPTFVIWPTQDGIFPELPDQAALRGSLRVAAERCKTTYVWKRYGGDPCQRRASRRTTSATTCNGARPKPWRSTSPPTSAMRASPRRTFSTRIRTMSAGSLPRRERPCSSRGRRDLAGEPVGGSLYLDAIGSPV